MKRRPSLEERRGITRSPKGGLFFWNKSAQGVHKRKESMNSIFDRLWYNKKVCECRLNKIKSHILRRIETHAISIDD
ncbi:hypothetical protein HMSSN139_62970 [Paenibacillus sp. HMSSN-139]|nr:hypothetical protein HMSSN139_62970 [Paenibacillus sp. HMSSN-139]